MSVNVSSTISSKGIGILVSLAAVPFAVFLGRAVAQGNMRMVAMVFAVGVLFFLVFGMANWLWIFAVGSIFVPGQLTFLPLPLRPVELLLCLLIARFFVENVIFKKQWLRKGPAPDWIFLSGLLLVFLIHGYNDRFAMRLFGSSIWGGRQYVAILIGFASYFVVQSTTLDTRAFRHLPTIVVLFGAVDFSMMLISQLVPGLSHVLWNVYTGVSLEAGVEGARWGFMGNFGYLLLYWSLSDCRINEFVTKGRVIKGAVFCLAIAMCLACGYRSSVAVAALIVGVAAFRDFGFKGILGILPVVVVVGVLLLVQSIGVTLPKQVQRGLTFLPGEWDQQVVESADSSMDFREEVWALWRQIEFPKHPLLGRGFGLTEEQMMATQPFIVDGGINAPRGAYSRNEAFVVSGNIHNGFYSAIDRFGLVGLLCIILWTAVVVRRIWKYLIESRGKPMNPALQWLGLYIIAITIGFWPGALKIEQFLVTQLFFVGLFWALMGAERNAEKKTVSEAVLVSPENLAPAEPKAGFGRPTRGQRAFPGNKPA